MEEGTPKLLKAYGTTRFTVVLSLGSWDTAVIGCYLPHVCCKISAVPSLRLITSGNDVESFATENYLCCLNTCCVVHCCISVRYLEIAENDWFQRCNAGELTPGSLCMSPGLLHTSQTPLFNSGPTQTCKKHDTPRISVSLHSECVTLRCQWLG